MLPISISGEPKGGIFTLDDELDTLEEDFDQDQGIELMKTQALRAVYLTAEDLRVTASLLFNAYHDDPFFIHSFGHQDLATYEQKLRAVIREELNELWQQEQPIIGVYDKDRLVGVTCMLTHQFSIGESRFWHWRFKMVLGTDWRTTQALIQKESSIYELLPSARFGIIQFIAVAPKVQNQGVGKFLVEAVKSWLDEQQAIDGVGVFVSNKAHESLFTQRGFEISEAMRIADLSGNLVLYRKPTTAHHSIE